MAISTVDLTTIYDDFLKKGLDKLKELQEFTQMEDDALATASSNIIIGAMSNSIQGIKALQEIESARADDNIKVLNEKLIKEQIVTEKKRAIDIVSATETRNAQSTKDIAIKDQQELAEKIKNGNVSISHTYDEDGNVLTTTYGVGTSKSVYEAQIETQTEQTNLLKKQEDTEVKKALDVMSATASRNIMTNRDVEIKTQQAIGEQIKNGGFSIGYTYNREVLGADGIISYVSTYTTNLNDINGYITDVSYTVGTSLSLYTAQVAKTVADEQFTKEQKKQLGYSVIYNNRLKTLEDYGSTLSNIGMGGFIIPSPMWETYFNMANDCYLNWGDVPTDKTVTETTMAYPSIKA